MARELLSVSSISINDLNDAVVSGTAPSNPDEGMLWLNDKVLKQYTNGTWKTVTLDISKMDEALAETIKNMKETLGNISNDGILTFIDRQTIASNVGSIIGEMPSTSAKSMSVLPSYTALDSQGVGTFAFLRHTARDIGMDEESSFFKEMQDTYTNLVSYISSTTPKMWDITTANKDKVITLSDKDTFNGYWLNYYLSEASMSGEIDRLANIKLDEITSGSSVQDKDETMGEGIAFTNKGDKEGRVYPTISGANFPKVGNTGKNLFNVREFVALNSSTFYALDNSNETEDDVLIVKGVDGSNYVDYKYLIPVKPNTKYTFSSDRTATLRLGEYNSSKAPIQQVTTSAELTAHTFTTTAQTRYVAFKFVSNSQKPMYISNIQLEEGTKRTSYEPSISSDYPVKPKQLDNFYLVGAKGRENRRSGNENSLNSTGAVTLTSALKVEGYEDWGDGEDVYEVRASSTGAGALFYADTNEYHPNKEVTESIKVKNIGPNPFIIHSNGITGPNSSSIRVLPGEDKIAVFNGTHRDSWNFTQLHITPRADIADGKNYLMNSGSPTALDFRSNNHSLYPITKGVEGGVDWIEPNWLEEDGFLLSTYVQQNYTLAENFSATTGPYDPYLKGYTGPITYSIDVMSEYPMVINFGISTTYTDEVTLVPGKWTRLSYTNDKGLSDTRPGSLFGNRDGKNADIPNRARIYWRNYKIEKGSLSDGTANGLYAPQGSEANANLNFLATNHTYHFGGYTPFARRMVNISESEPTTSIIKHKIELEDGLRYISEACHDEIYFDYSDNLWKIKRMTGEFKLNGTESYGYALESSWSGKRAFRMGGYANGMSEYASDLVSSHFRYSDTGQITSSNQLGEFGRNNVKGVRAHNLLFVTSHTTLAQFVSWLKSQSDKGTPVTIWFELQEPQIDILSDELQNKLNNIYTYEGSSYIWADSPLNPKITATFKSQAYVRNKETKDDLDSKLDKDEYNPDDIVAQSVTATWDNYGDMIEGTVSQLTTYESRVETLQTLFSQTQESFNFNFNALTTTVGDNQTANDENFSKISKFIRFEGGNIILGEDGSSTYLEISKDKITFNNAGSEVAYISNQTMEITHGIFVQTATIAGMRIQRIPGSNNIGFTVIQ